MFNAKKKIQEDNRFYIDEFNLNRITQWPIISYTLEKVRLNQIVREIDGIRIPITETEVYRLINEEPNAEEDYVKYCDKRCIGNPKRSVEEVRKLYKSMYIDDNDYDPHKGIMIIDSKYRIVEGLHRTCILHKKCGPEYEIEVLKIEYMPNISVTSIVRHIRKHFKRRIDEDIK